MGQDKDSLITTGKRGKKKKPTKIKEQVIPRQSPPPTALPVPKQQLLQKIYSPGLIAEHDIFIQ